MPIHSRDKHKTRTKERCIEMAQQALVKSVTIVTRRRSHFFKLVCAQRSRDTALGNGALPVCSELLLSVSTKWLLEDRKRKPSKRLYVTTEQFKWTSRSFFPLRARTRVDSFARVLAR